MSTLDPPTQARGSVRFSVVVPAFNAAQTVTSAVESALAQTETDLEVIVVDDGSSDATGELVSKITDPRVRLVSQTNRGLSAARNAGITAARGTYIAFLDSDDLWLPRFLELTYRALEGVADPGFAYTDAYAFDALSGRVRRRTVMQHAHPPAPPPTDPDAFLLELLERNFVYVSTVVPAEVLAAVDGFDEHRHGAEDHDLWLRIVLAGYRAVWVPGQHALYRLHSGQLTGNELRTCRGVCEMYDTLDMDSMPTAAHRELLRRCRRRAHRELRLLAGEAPLRAAVREGRHVLGRVRQRVGLGDSWDRTPPAEVAAVFEDLAAV